MRRRTYDESPRDIAWLYGRREWQQKLHPGWWHQHARDVAELGARAAACLWAEQESAVFWIRQRASRH